MTKEHRTAPDPEWVQMYRQGITTPKIAAGAGMAETTVRYHLVIAARLEPSIRDEHREAAFVPPRITAAGRQNLQHILALYRTEGRLPTTSAATARERALGVWLHRRRQEAAKGVLSPIYKEGLDVIPGWHHPSTKKANDESRWKQRLAEVASYRAGGKDWPRHNKTDIKEERVLGVWLHVQRIGHRAGRLDPTKEAQLDAVIPGWRTGRARGRR
ncbi:helicase associated domain-containing protein [Pseudarthrobacter sulfonivorans]|uniref:helicase associated domain-containing protein n=1 Tax=Pseudarthrobacter sulfonivorans TaxID=121292 RepID=UPI00285E965A|nr:helicase associated domain-containing protein [Pseudarthrobacter sulfonivorans]MDR6417570.1 hypothetical protein [Pseudarthrobacter sulfonivorans]